MINVDKKNEHVRLLEEEISVIMERIETITKDLASSREQLTILEIEIAARKKDLTSMENAQKKLEGKLQYKDEFITLLAHELRNPLTPIIHSVEILKLTHSDDKELVGIINTIERQAKNISLILKNLLDASRAARGKISLNMKPLDVKEVLEHAIGTVNPLLVESGNNLSAEWLPLRVDIMGDSTRLEQVFVNILSNAIKYTPRGGTITVNVFQETDHILIAIKDNGVGISSESLPYIFDLFMQENQGAVTRKGGLGIGLMLARAFTELQGGTLTAASEGRDKGSVFTVKLPIRSGHEHTGKSTLGHAASTEEAPIQVSSKRVLLIDDNEKLLETFQKLLRALDQHVRIANNAEDAIREAEAYIPEIVFMDISMPDMEGYELVKKLKKIPSLSQTYFVALTGLGDRKIIQKCLTAGFDQHLLKPIGAEDIRAVLRKNSKTSAA
jgi:two-component system CheB/CheR fusion protein